MTLKKHFIGFVGAVTERYNAHFRIALQSSIYFLLILLFISDTSTSLNVIYCQLYRLNYFNRFPQTMMQKR